MIRIKREDDDHYLVWDGKRKSVIRASCRKEARLKFKYGFEGYRMWRDQTIPAWRELAKKRKSEEKRMRAARRNNSMTEINCDPIEVAERARSKWPSRILVNEKDMAVSHQIARAEFDITWDFILIRNDGWTLGSPEDLAATAYSLWPTFWIGFIVEGDQRLYAMNDWSKRDALLEAAHRK